MANQEHVRIVRADQGAIEAYWGEPIDRLTGELLPRVSRPGFDLTGADLRGLELVGACLINADLRGADLSHARLVRCNLQGANLAGANLFGAFLADCCLVGADFHDADLLRAALTESLLWCANLRNARLWGTDLFGAGLEHADLTGADVSFANFGCADLTGAILNGVVMESTGTDGCKFDGVVCTHFYTVNRSGDHHAPTRVRIPDQGYLAQGEFEDRIKSRPTIQFIFEHGTHPLDREALNSAVDRVNAEHPEAGLRMLEITTANGSSQAVFEMAEKMPKKEGMELLRAHYEEVLDRMHAEFDRERRGYVEILSNKVPSPPADPPTDGREGPSLDVKPTQGTPALEKKPAPRKRGRPRLAADPDEVQRRREIKAKWEDARACGHSKARFCKDARIAVTRLDAVLRWLRDHGK